VLTCKQVAKNLADRDYAELSPLKRLSLKLHVLLCVVCGRYHRHVMRFQDGVRRYRRGEGSRATQPKSEFCLLSEERESIRRALESDSGEREE
jgi:hypothetical protein